MGFTELSESPHLLVSSYLTVSPSPFPSWERQTILCGTFLQVTLTGCYPAFSSVEPGLSSILFGQRLPLLPQAFRRIIRLAGMLVNGAIGKCIGTIIFFSGDMKKLDRFKI